MKKLLCLMLVLLLLPLSVLAEEENALSLSNYNLFTVENQAYLHLRLKKTGADALLFNGIGVDLLDAAGGTISTLSAEIVEQPLMEIPTGTHYFSLTLRFDLPEGVTPADFVVNGVNCTFGDWQTPTLLPDGPAYFLTPMDGVYYLMAWVPAEGFDTAAGHFFSAWVVDETGTYLGNGLLPMGGARLVSGSDMPGAVSLATGWTPQELADQGFAFPASQYVLFDWYPLPHLDPASSPDSLLINAYVAPQGTEQMVVTPYADAITFEADGRFTIQGYLQNNDTQLMRLTSIDSLTMYDSQGATRECLAFEVKTPFLVLYEGELMPYIITGQVEPGFEPDQFRMGYTFDPTDDADHQMLGFNTIDAAQAVENATGIRCTSPLTEGLDPADYFAVYAYFGADSMFTGLEWTLPGEAQVEEGEVVLPAVDLEKVRDGQAFVTIYLATRPEE